MITCGQATMFGFITGILLGCQQIVMADNIGLGEASVRSSLNRQQDGGKATKSDAANKKAAQAQSSQPKSAPAKTQAKAARKAPDRPKSAFVRGNYVLSASLPVAPYKTGAKTVVVVDKGSHFTHALQLQDNRVVRTYTMSNAIGKDATPTPPGRYSVIDKKEFPKWTPPKSIDPKQKVIGPYNQNRKNPLGVAAIYLNKFGILLHGTNQPTSIRRDVSHGCVRHSNKDISKLYGMVDDGDVVYIVNRFRGHVVRERDFK